MMLNIVVLLHKNMLTFGEALTGFAMNEELVKHYGEAFNAEYLGLLHPNQIFIDEKSSQKIIREYDYEWTEDDL